MSNAQKDQLFSLISTLTKAEKRAFKLYANRFQGVEESKFIQLFDVLDKLSDYEEDVVLKKLPDVEKRHLSNLKRHLYKQLLTSLRLIHIQKNIDIQIREQLDFARILYGKGLYMQSLRILERIKQIATDHHQDILHLEILEFQKLIEARHITRSRMVENKMESLLEEADRRSYISHATSLFSNLNIQIHGYYIQYGHATTPQEVIKAEALWKDIFPHALDDHKLTFFEKANLYQSLMWYNYILLNFAACKENAWKWVDLFDSDPPMREKDPDLFMRGLYYLLTFIYLSDDHSDYEYYLQEFEDFQNEMYDNMNANSRMISCTYLHLSRLNLLMLNGKFTEGIKLVPVIDKAIKPFEQLTDIHRILLFYFKFAFLYFACGKYEESLTYLNKITLLKHGHLRDDLHINARLLHLMCYYDLGNYEMVIYFAPQLDRVIKKAVDICQTQTRTLKFIKHLVSLPLAEREEAFKVFKTEITEISDNPEEIKALLYLNVIFWVDSHLENKTVSELFAKRKAAKAV